MTPDSWASTTPVLIQGGMGVNLAPWPLAREVAEVGPVRMPGRNYHRAVAWSLFAPLLVVFVVSLSSVWVLQDARTHERDRRPVVVTVFGRTLEDPPIWAALCLVLFMLVFPLYLIARRAGS